ncbi:T9SS type A sorting domain-containing protein [bacterium]|nr:T9SS type A sorting domain-containing protein [bacterium]
MRNTFLILSIFLFTSAATIHAQPDSLWSRTYGEHDIDECDSMILTAEGGFILGGVTRTSVPDNFDMWLVKTDVEGNPQWSRSYGGSESEVCHSVIQTNNEGYILTGFTSSYGVGERDIWMVKINADGDSLWSRTFGGSELDVCKSIIQTVDGGYALAGLTQSFGAGGYDMWLVKTNADGDSLWSRTFGGSELDVCKSIIQTVDGGYALAGYTESFGAGGRDMWLVKTDADGDSLWSRTFGGRDSESCHSILQTGDEGFTLAGCTESFGSGEYDMWLVKTDNAGDSLWSSTYGGDEREDCFSVIQTTDDGYTLAGMMYSADTEEDMLLVRTDVNGDSLWSRSFGGELLDDCQSIIQMEDGSYALAGRTLSYGAGFTDFWLVQTGPDPVFVSSESFNPHPSSFILQPAFPNPFNSFTNIRFDLPLSSDVSVSILDLNGRSVATLLDNHLNAGNHSLIWNAKDHPAGVYLCRVDAGGVSLTRKLLLVK